MNEKEKLYEQYEDAFFALLMEEVAEAEGTELLEKNEQLQADPNAAVPEIVTKRCLNVIENHYRKSKRRQTARHAAHVLNRVAMVILVPILLFAFVFAASETVRVKTLNFVIEEFHDGTAFFFQSEDTAQDSAFPDVLSIALQSVPKDFSLVSYQEDRVSDYYVFQNAADAEISIRIWRLQGENATVQIDTENADVQYEDIFGQNIMIVHKNEVYQIAWICEDQQYMMVVRGINVSLDDMMFIAEKLIS